MLKKLVFVLLFSFASVTNAATYGDSNDFWVGGNPWIQVVDTSVSGKGGSPVIAVYGVFMEAGIGFNTSTIPNTQYPGSGFLEIDYIYRINIPGINTLGHISQLFKARKSLPLMARVSTLSGFRDIPVYSPAQAVVAARALAENLPITYEENCVGTVCNGFVWIQIEQ